MLKEEFFDKNVVDLARSLLGCRLVHETKEGKTAGIIVETESYHQEDAASHSYNGETARTKVMFGPPGHAYIYFTYGIHYCFNIVADMAGIGAGVLIRALEPVEGIDLMKIRRDKVNTEDLTNGPAKLVQAMGITKADYGKPLFSGNLFIEARDKTYNLEIRSGPRIGIKKAIDKPWRFWVDGNPFVSKLQKSKI